MEALGKVLLFVFGIFGAIIELIEFLLLPTLFLLFGLWQQMPWQYYAITIGGYFGLWLLLEIALRLIFRWVGKKYSSRFERALVRLVSKFSKDGENSADVGPEHN